MVFLHLKIYYYFHFECYNGSFFAGMLLGLEVVLADGKTITGTWKQGSTPLDLVLRRASKETAWEIPAPPPPPKLMAADADPAFEVATIKPNNTGATSMQQFTLNGRNVQTRASSLQDLITFAYEVQAKQIVGAPEWISTDRYDIAAVPDVE